MLKNNWFSRWILFTNSAKQWLSQWFLILFLSTFITVLTVLHELQEIQTKLIIVAKLSYEFLIRPYKKYTKTISQIYRLLSTNWALDLRPEFYNWNTPVIKAWRWKYSLNLNLICHETNLKHSNLSWSLRTKFMWPEFYWSILDGIFFRLVLQQSVTMKNDTQSQQKLF